MKNTIGLLMLLVIGFTSCEGRKTSKQALTESVTKFKSNNTIISENYIPKVYREVSMDTVLSNGFRVFTKTFTNMKTNVINTVKKDSITEKILQRDIESLIIVEFKNQVVFEKTISKQFIVNSSTNLKTDLTRSILKGTWINEDITTRDNSIHIDIQYCSVSNNECQNFNLIVDTSGNYNLNSLKENTF